MTPELEQAFAEFSGAFERARGLFGDKASTAEILAAFEEQAEARDRLRTLIMEAKDAGSKGAR